MRHSLATEGQKETTWQPDDSGSRGSWPLKQHVHAHIKRRHSTKTVSVTQHLVPEIQTTCTDFHLLTIYKTTAYKTTANI